MTSDESPDQAMPSPSRGKVRLRLLGPPRRRNHWVGMAGGALILVIPRCPELQSIAAGHRIMGVFFGVIHLAYGIYLYFTENRKNAA